MNTILESLEQHARQRGDREFLVFEDERLTLRGYVPWPALADESSKTVDAV
jgi:hypothetical protein